MCDVIQKKASMFSKDPAAIFAATSASNNLNCQVNIDNVQATLSNIIENSKVTKIETIYQAVASMTSMGLQVDSQLVCEKLIKTSKVDTSVSR